MSNEYIFLDTIYTMFRYLKPPATAGDFATCHVTLFGWRNGGRAGTFARPGSPAKRIVAQYPVRALLDFFLQAGLCL